MNLVKWLRKNNMKVMAVVVVIIMIGFTIGPALRYLGQRRTGQQEIIAYFADNREITNYDLVAAHRELEILRLLHADIMLKSLSIPLLRMPDLRGFLLSELLFAEQRTSPLIINRIKQLITTSQYSISDKQINDIYRRTMPSNIYWLLLKKEAQLAGVKTPNENAGRVLSMVIPQLFNGETYSRVIGTIIDQQGVPEKEILTTFSKLMAVLEYAKMICAAEDFTSSQIMHTLGRDEETINAEFVKFDSALFAETQDEPTEEELIEHFEKYRNFFESDVNEQNPYGFGYKLPNRVQLEYVAVKLDDVSAIVTEPTQQELEEYYEKNREQFTATVPSDPNDPNSTPIEQTKTYAEVADTISEQLLQNKIISKATEVLDEAGKLIEAGLQNSDTEPANLTTDQLKQLVGDYQTTAEQLSNRYNIKVYAGQTGLLSAADMRKDEYLGKLYLRSRRYSPMGLTRIVFAVEQLQVSELGPFDVPKPRLYENIGPFIDTAGQIMLLARVTKAAKASVPENISQTFNKDTIRLHEKQLQQTENIYSIKEKVADDLKKLLAMDTTKKKAEEFIDLAATDDWENAVDKFNALYGQQDKQDITEPNISDTIKVQKSFVLQNLTNLRRTSSMTLEGLVMQSRGNPMVQPLINEAKKEIRFIDQLYSLIPQDSNTTDNKPLILESKPNTSYYCIKNISVKRLDLEQYETIKAMRAYRENFIQSQNMAPVHFAPENILKRMKFRPLGQDKESADANNPAEAQG
ncbi:MAG: hypothetical protein JSV82_00345 [Planctomycetota bacterium]|nr:MAG: hypothetical protein JSV82_00345 [Planctomycetota bacterium]